MSESWDKRGFNINKLMQEKYNISLTNEEIDYIYNLGVKKYEIGDFENSMPIFEFLTLLKPGNSIYIKSIASCMQNLEKYMEAYMYYQSAFVVDFKHNQDCLFFMAFCAIKMQKEDQAKELLNQFLRDNNGHEYEKKAKLLLHGLTQKDNDKS